jgi:hypothetical protein
MPASTTYVVQGFEHVGGRLVTTMRNVAQSEKHALLQAEAFARKFSGAAALRLVRDEGEMETTTVLGAFGDVPDDFSDALAGG